MSFWIASAVRIRPRRRVCSWVSSPDGTSVGGRRRSLLYVRANYIQCSRLFSTSPVFILLIYSFISLQLVVFTYTVYKARRLSRVVPAVSWFVWRNKQKRKMNVHNHHLSELLSAGPFLLTDLTSSWWRRKHCWDRSVSVWSTPLSRPGDGHVVDPCTSSSLAFCSLPAATSEAAMLTLQQKYTSLQPGAAQSLKSTVHRQTGNVNNSWCDRNKAISLSVLYVHIRKQQV